MGLAATFAEPAISTLKTAGSNVKPQDAVLLYEMLNRSSGILVTSVGIGVGIATILGIYRFVANWSLKVLLLPTLAITLPLTLLAEANPATRGIISLAWDTGAVTTGPVTVPLVLALGIGVSAAAGRQDNPLSGFGIVTLASLFPAMAVILVAAGLVAEVPDPAALPALVGAGGTRAWWDETPVAELLASVRAIAPLILLLWLAQRFVLGEKLAHRQLIVYGVVVAVLGMTLFNVGLTIGLIPLGDQAGNVVPSAFHAVSGGEPLYPYPFGVALTLLFAATIGYGATVAEPALNAMGVTVENLTDGAFPRRLLIRSVAVGVALGTALGVAKIIFQWPMLPLLLGAYAVALVCTVLSVEEYVSLAWDSAGVTTGPVTVPLVFALGLGLSKAVGAAEGFGILAMASAGPIISVLAVGLWIRRRSAGES